MTLHGVLVLPALAWLVARTGRNEPQRLRIVAAGVAAYAVAVAAVLVLELV